MRGTKTYKVEDKISIRPITYGDTDTIVRWRNEDRIRMNFLFREPFTNEMHENWMRSKVETGMVEQFIIEELVNERPIGSVYLRDVDYEIGQAEYGIFLGEEDALEKGYGNLAAKWAVEYARELGLKKLILRVLADNCAAVQSYKNAGYVETAYYKKYLTDEIGDRDLMMMERIL